MGPRFASYLLSLVLVPALLAAAPAQAYSLNLTQGGVSIHWPSGFAFNVAGNSTNVNGLSETNFYDAVVTSLQRWQAAMDGTMSFNYWQGTNDSVYPPNSDYNGQNSVYFASAANGSTGLSGNLLGLTQVWYSTSNGQIVEADTALNDQDFTFTMTPTDTTGYGSGDPSAARRVYVENVLTHEFGHSMGLAHSGQLQATMLYMESPEQAHLGCDEQAAIHAIYPTGDAGSRGTITGTVVSPSGAPVFGADVAAISVVRGTVMASAMTNPSGVYSISGLEEGEYFILAEPYHPAASTLPVYYSGISSAVCSGGADFGRTFLTDSNGYTATAVNAPGGGSVGAPKLTVGCDSGGAAVNAGTSSTSVSGAPSIFNGTTASAFGMTDRFSSYQAHYYGLSDVSGDLAVHVLAFSLYSPVRLTVNLLNSSGQTVSTAQIENPVYTGDSGYVNYDAAVSATGLAEGDYVLEVVPSPESEAYYPAGQISLDTVPFVLVTGTENAAAPALASEIPVNARCRMNESFPAYQSPPGNPPVASTQSSDNSGGSGGCGMIDTSGSFGGGDSSGKGGGPGGGSAGAVGWLLPWLAMAAAARFARRLARERR